MKKYTTEALVLKNRNYGDAHKFYTLFTRDRGKISAMAMGVRKISSRRSGNLDTINQVLISVNEDSKGFKTIQEVRTIRSFYEIKNDLPKISVVYKMAGLLDELTDYDHDVLGVYELFLWAVRSLSDSGDLLWLENVYKFRLFDILGFGMEVNSCANCGKGFESKWVRVSYNPHHGGIVCPDCSGMGVFVAPEVLDTLRDLRAGSEEIPNNNETVHGVNHILSLHQNELIHAR